MKFGLKTNYPEFGLLIIRIGLGALFIYHGWPNLVSGTAKWAKIGQSMSVFGINSIPAFWGFMISFVEVAGGALVIIGILFKSACFLLFLTSLISVARYADNGVILEQGVHALRLSIVLLGLFFVGPGSIRFSSK